MPQIINHPRFGQVSFPDEMSDEQIVEAFKRLEAEPAQQADTPPLLPCRPSPARRLRGGPPWTHGRSLRERFAFGVDESGHVTPPRAAAATTGDRRR